MIASAPALVVMIRIVLRKSTLRPKLSVKPAFFHHLQQHVEHVGMGFLDFVEQHHGVRPAADLFGQLAAFLEADVARRSADQAG